MAKNLNMQLTVTADASQAKREMQSLQQQLSKLGSQSYTNMGFGDKFTKDIQKAKSEVAELQVSLRNAFNVDTGKLDFTKFNQQLQRSGKTLQDYGASLMKLGPEGQQAFLSLTKSVANSEIPIIRVSNRLKEMGTTLKNTIRWQISSSVLHTFVGAIQQAYGYAKDLNASLNNIRIVTGQSTEQMAKFAEYANQSAKALSTTTTNVTNAALIYYQQGLSDEEVRKRTETTIKLANVTKDSAEEVSSQMTAIWNNFAKGSENLEIYADKITALGAATASSSAEIAEGLEKFAAVADTVGLSYDLATAALATVVAQTRQSADIVGTAFKTLFARLESLNLEGSFTDEEGTTVSLNKYSKALEQVGVNIFQANGQLKDMDEILDDMGAKWQTLDKNSQVALAQTVGGMRQYNQLIALMDNYDFFKQNIEIAKNAEGTLQQQQKIYEESWEAANKRLKASWEALYSDIIEDDFFIELTDSVSKFLQAIDKIIDRMGGVKGLLLQIAPLATQLYNKEIANFMSNTFNTARMMVPGQRRVMEKERDTFVQEGLTEAQSTLGKNTAAYAKFESEIKYQETVKKYHDLLTDFDKQYLEALHKQNEARVEELENLEKELELIKKRNQEAQKGFSKEYIAEGIEGASTKSNLEKIGNNLITSFGIEQFTADDSIAESAQIGQLRAYLIANKDVLSQTYAEGGLGAGSQGLLNRLNKLTEDYLAEMNKETPDQRKTDEIYERINSLITKYIEEILTGRDRGKAITSSVENILNQDKKFKQDTSAARKAVDIATQDLAKKVGTQSTDSALEEKANQEIAVLEQSIQSRSKEIKSLENKTAKTDEESNQLDSAKAEQEQQITKLKELKDSLQQYQNAIQDETQTTEEIDDIKEQQVQLLRDAANAQAVDRAKQEEMERRIAEARGQISKNSQREGEEAAKRGSLDNVGTAERLTAISTALMGITAAANAAGNAIDTLFDDAATPAEKFKAILQSMITIMFQIGNLTRGNTLDLIKNTFVTNTNTIAEKANEIASRKAGQAKEKKGQQTDIETSSLDQNTVSNNINSGSEVAKGRGFKLALWDSAKGGTTSLGSVAFVIAAIIAAVKTFTFFIDRYQSAHEENIKKLKEENEAIENWRQENSAALEAAHNYSNLNTQLKQGIINQEEYNKQLSETAKQLKINNAEALAQAGAYDLLEKSTKAAAEELNKEEYNKAIQSDINSRNLMTAGDDSIMQEAMNMAFFGAGDFFGGLSGDYSNYGKTTKRIGTGMVTEAGEAALISELRQLNINGVQIADNGDISWDTASMATRDLAKLSQFFADVTSNSSKYGGEDNEIIKVLNKMNEDWSATAKTIQESATIEDRQEIEWFLQGNKAAQQALQSGSKGYTALLNTLGDQFGEETARAVLKNYFKTEDVQRGEIINAFAKTYGFDAVKLQNSLEGFADAEKALEAIGQESELMATALQASGQSFEGLTNYIQLCIDKIDVETFGDKLASIQKLLNSLNFGDLIDEKQYNQLIEQFGKELVSKYVAVLPNGEYRVINDISELQSEAVQQAKDIVDKFREQGTEKSITEAQRLMDEFEWEEVRLDDRGNKLSPSITNIGEAEAKSDNINDLIKQNQEDIDRINKIKNYLGGEVGDKINIRRGDRAEALEVLKNNIFGNESNNISDEAFINYLKNAGIEFSKTSKTNTQFYINNAATSQSLIDEKTQEITDLTTEKTEIDNKIKAWAELNGLVKEYQELEKNPFALEDKLVNSSTTFEQLQDLANKYYISNEKYQESIAGAAAASAEALGLDKKALIEQAKYLEENNKYVANNYEASMQLALSYQRQSKALTDLNSNMDSLENALKNSEKDSQELVHAISALEADMQNLFNTDESISENFIIKHLEDIKKAAKDDEKAIKRLQEAYAMDILSSDGDFGQKAINEVQGYIDSINWENLEIGMSVDTQPALQDLWDFYQKALKEGTITEEQLQEVWNALGFELEPILKKVWEEYPYQAQSAGAPSGHWVDSFAGFAPPKYAGRAKASTTPDTSKKKGSGKSRSKKDQKELKDEFERYYTISRQLQDQIDLLDKLGKAKDRAWGKAKLEYIEKETKALEDELTIQEKYLKEIQDYYKEDQKNLNFFGAKYDENGVVTNYDEMIKKELDRYNAAVKKYNAGGSEATFSKAEQRYEDFKKKLKQYDDTNELYQKKLEEIQELQYQIYDKELEKITTKVEMDIQVNDAELKKLEYDLDRIQKKAFATAEAIAKLSDQLNVNLDSQSSYQEGLESILANHGINSIDEISGLSEDEIANLGFTEDEVNTLLDYNNSLIDTQSTIDELQETIMHGMVDAFEEWNKEFDYQQDKIATNIDLLKQYQDIADLIYSNASGVTDEFITNLMESQYVQMVNGVDAAYNRLDVQKKALEEARAEYENLIASGASEQTLTAFRNDLREMEAEVEKSQSDMLKKTEEALKQAEDIFKNAVENMTKIYQQMTHTTDWDMTQFDRLKKLDDEYLDDYEKIYELSKLTRDVNNSIDDMDTIRAKERLKEITQEIADIEASGKEVSQYEVDALRKKYELRLAEIALEDAQAAKQTVRMSRDNDGNWSYIYTADNDNVDKARQNYEDKLYEYQKLNSEFIKEQQENFLKLEQEYVDAMTKIAEDSSLNQEDKENRLRETQEYYQRMADIMSDQLGIALNRNSELYTKDWLDYSKNTGYKISKEEEYQTKLQNTYTGVLQPNIESATELLAQFTEATVGDDGFFPAIISALDEFNTKQDEVLNAAGTSLEDYSKLVSNVMKETAQGSQDAADTVRTSAEEMKDAFDQVIAKIKELNGKKLDGLRSDVDTTVNAVNKLISTYKQLSNAIDSYNNKQNNSGVNSATYKASPKSTTGGGTGGSTGQKVSVASDSKNNLNESQLKSLSQILMHIGLDQSSSSIMSMQKVALGTSNTKTLIGSNLKNETAVYHRLKQFTDKDIASLRTGINNNYKYLIDKYGSFDTGGYTGAWGTEGRLAMLHQKELVLNAHDTENMLNTIQMVRDIVASIDTRAAAASVANISAGYAGATAGGPQTLDQNVHIEANFPNVTDHNEIELAITGLVNRASQYVGRKKL